MNKYYIPELNLRDIRNDIDLLNRFEQKFNKTTNKTSIILSTNGYYKYNKEKLTKFKLIENDTNIVEEFIKGFSLIELNYFEKSLGEVFQIPYENKNIILEKIKFNIGNSSNYIVFERVRNRIVDVYFLSSKKIKEDNKFFIEDVSSFIEMLNI